MAATVIGVFVRAAGVWERANGGTPIAFSGPQVRRSGSWTNCVDVQANVSNVWNMTWVNINTELDVKDWTATDLDFSPYSVSCYVEINPDGSVDRLNNGVTSNNYSHWRDYDVGRTIQFHCLEDVNYSSTYVTSEPTKGVWGDLTATKTFSASKSGTGFLSWDTGWATYYRDKDRADPLGSVPRGDVDLSLEAEI